MRPCPQALQPLRLETADSLPEALARFTPEAPDCLLVDQEFAALADGSLLAALPRTTEGLPACAVVVLADAAAAPGTRALLRAGVQDIVPRELPPGALGLAVGNAIERHALAREAVARERALQESEAHWRHSIEFNPQMAWSADALGRVASVSERWLERVGLTREQALGEGWIQLPHPSDLTATVRAWSRSVRTGEPYDIEHRIRLADGSYRWMRSRALPRRDAGGRIVHWYGTMEDIDDRKQAEFALRISEERFRELADNISQLAWTADGDGWVYWFNRRWYDYTGLTEEQALGWGWKQLHHPEHHERVMAGIRHSWDSGEAWEDVFPLRGRDGSYRWFLSRATPVRASDGSVLRWCGTHTDVTDQRAAEAALRRSEERFRIALAHSPVMVFEQDLALRYRWISNPLPGLDCEAFAGRRPHELMRAEDADALEALARKAISSRRTVRQEVTLLLHDGRRLWWDLTVEPMVELDGRLSGVIGSAVDRTDSKRSELALKESEDRLELALQVARGFAFDWDRSSGRVIRSCGFGALLGLPDDEAAAQPQSSVGHHVANVHPEDRAALEQRLRELRPEQPAYVAQYRVVRPDGRIVTLEEAARGSFDEAGRLAGLVGLCADVTQRVEAETLRRRHEHELQTLADNTPDILVRFDRALRCVFANAAIEDVIGLKPARLLGRSFSGLGLPSALCGQWETALREVMASGEARTLEFTLVRPDGTHHYSGRLVPEPDGARVEQVLAVVHDVTERRLMEQEREELLAAERAARTELERIAQLKDQFLATLSHELRTPLNAIVGWTHLLRRQAAESKLLQDGLDVIGRNARLQTQLIDDLLDMNRILAGKLVMEARPVEPEAVAQNAADSLRLAAERKGVQLELRQGEALPRLQGDAGRLQQVLVNLLSNAVKFTPSGGRVTLATRRCEGGVQFVVEDSGQGIEPHFLPRLFERFSQADASTTRSHDGLGLGLSIVKHLVELHGGSVAAASDGPGRGATFTVTLPAAEGGDAAAAPRSPASADAMAIPVLDGGGASLAGLTVLLVDDQPDALEPVRRLLKECGARVLTAGSGFEALDSLRREHPDLLVSDVGMPGMDGYRLIREVRERLGLGADELPALALTAFSRAEDRQKALAAGFQAHLGKPLEPQLVLSTVERLAARSVRARAVPSAG
ncbi:PAS domain S-box protein [Caldimonas tepidiphila]|uniref:PAS domain S-box protein n=1 Tax=Caldimonas tepidiphila TaxID=2315841 RepID=UPI001472B07B|nr:PAS domain S-box protein [Caldimonas tepidiphila]